MRTPIGSLGLFLVLCGACTEVSRPQCQRDEDCPGIAVCLDQVCVPPAQVESSSEDDDCDGGAGACGEVEPRFVDAGDGTIRDSDTSLSWQRIPPSADYGWQAAIDYCDTLTLAARSEWHLPSLNELLTLLTTTQGTGGDYQGGCYWNPVFEGDCQSSPYLTATETSQGQIAVVGFYLGRLYFTDAGDQAHVRCVSGED